MLMEQLFSSGLMRMGPSRTDPDRQVGVFNPGAVAGLPEIRATRMDEFRWIAGDWSYENAVPATTANPAYSDIGACRYAIREKNNWVCIVAPDGRETQQITFDPFSKQWIYVLMNGAYGMLRSPEGWRNDQIIFTGLMTMIGINCEWRIRWTKENTDQFSFVNEERDGRDSWAYIDEWHFRRKSG
jgi:hypothetical protein